MGSDSCSHHHQRAQMVQQLAGMVSNHFVDLLIACIVPLIFGVQSLRTRGKPNKEERPDAQLMAFERTTKLVTSGIYKYIRHPLYSSLLLLAWGAFFKAPTQTGITLGFIRNALSQCHRQSG